MLPFAILGFVMKPLQLKGDVILIIQFNAFSRQFLKMFLQGSRTPDQKDHRLLCRLLAQKQVMPTITHMCSFHLLYLIQQGSQFLS